MKKVFESLRLCSVMLLVAHFNVSARIDFGSKNSMLSFGSDAKFSVNSSNLSIPGTLKLDESTLVSGSEFAFDDGALIVGSSESNFTGAYDPSSDDTIKLNGDSIFNAGAGTVLKALNVSGTGNLLTGQPTFDSAITLADNTTELGIGIKSKLNKNIVLNGGAVTLHDDLALADHVKLSGNGSVDLNFRQLSLGSFYQTPWSGDLTFSNALDIELNGSIELTGSWTFDGLCVINGNGAVIDLTSGGSLIINDDATLVLYNVIIKGIGSGLGGDIVLATATSSIKTTNTELSFAGNKTFTIGKIVANGPTTFAVGPHSCVFSSLGILAADGSVITVDFLDSESTPGGVFAPDDVLDPLNAGSNVNVNLTNNGYIRNAVGSSESTPSTDPGAIDLLSGNVTSDVTLSKELFLSPSQFIKINGNVVLDGQGTRIHFSGDKPQLIIKPGKTLTLKNVTLDNLTQNTIDIRLSSNPSSAGARYGTGVLKIDKNVTWVLDTSISFSSGKIVVLPTDDGTNIFKMRAPATRQSFSLAPRDIDAESTQAERNTHRGANAILSLGNSTLQLESITFDGLEFTHADYTNEIASPAIALSGDSTVNVGSYKVFGQPASDALTPFVTKMNFFVEGAGNGLIMTNDSNKLQGSILFGDVAENNLEIAFNYTPNIPARTISQTERFITTQSNDVVPINEPTAVVPAKVPLLVFAGDPGMFVFSEEGSAQLTFNAVECALQNLGDNSFILDDNSVVRYNTLYLYDYPVKQQSTNTRYFGTTRGTSFFDASFAVRSALAKQQSAKKKPCALQLKYKKARAKHKKMASEARKRELAEEVQVSTNHPENNVMRSSSRASLRTFTIPTGITSVDSVVDASGSAYSGAYLFKKGANVSNIKFDAGSPFDGYLTDGITLSTDPSQGVSIDSTHKLYIDTTPDDVANYLIINKSCTIDCSALVFNPAQVSGDAVIKRSQLAIKIPDPSTRVILTGVLTLPLGAVLTFLDKGDVKIHAGFSVVYEVSDTTVPLHQLPVINISNETKASVVPVSAFSSPITTTGRGYLRLEDKAQLDLSGNALIAGPATVTSALEYQNHELTIEVQPEAYLLLGDASGNSAVLCSRNSVFALVNRGKVYIYGGSSLLINTALDGVTPAPGRLSYFEHKNGSYFNSTGTLCIGDNSLSGGVPLQSNFELQSMSLEGTGSVKFITSDSSFPGITAVQSPKSSFSYPLASVSPLTIVATFANIDTTRYPTSYVFFKDNKWTLITKNGVTVQLDADEYPNYEDADGDIHCDTNSTNLNFVVKPDGKRIYANGTIKN